MSNIDHGVVAGFGDEWSRFDQSALESAELQQIFDSYFSEFPWADLPADAQGADIGCGSGRWASLAAPRVGRLHCVDPSPRALAVARANLVDQSNCDFHEASVDALPFADYSLDFAYSLGVLHHVPDTQDAIRRCVAALKPGAPLLLYLYYALENRPSWYRGVWKASDAGRRFISRSPYSVRYASSQVIAGAVYWPLARTARALERRGRDVRRVPLSIYRDKSFYTMRTDALDRFGTSLEQRFTRVQIEGMMMRAGLTGIRFRESEPFWCAVGTKAAA